MSNNITLINIRTLEGKAERMLAKYPSTRDSDLVLQIAICTEFYPPMEAPVKTYKDLIWTMQNLPSLDHVARVRRKIIEKHEYKKYLPNSLDVAKARKVNEQVWKTYAVAEKLPIHNPNSATGNIPTGWDDEGNVL